MIHPRKALVGIFVGGESKRMLGCAKGLLVAPTGETLVERWRTLFAARGLESVLVGERPEYAPLSMRTIADSPAGIGPLGGVIALLREAGERLAVVVGCDMPFVSGALIDRLLDAPIEPASIATRRHGRWEPMFSRIDAPRVLPLALLRLGQRELSLQGLFDEARTMELSLREDEQWQLADWDTPQDWARTQAKGATRE